MTKFQYATTMYRDCMYDELLDKMLPICDNKIFWNGIYSLCYTNKIILFFKKGLFILLKANNSQDNELFV